MRELLVALGWSVFFALWIVVCILYWDGFFSCLDQGGKVGQCWMFSRVAS
jgi:hypothetical protein